MRKVQITINMELFSDQAVNGESEKITVYADSNSIWETICAGFHELMKALTESGRKLPNFGVSEHH